MVLCALRTFSTRAPVKERGFIFSTGRSGARMAADLDKGQNCSRFLPTSSRLSCETDGCCAERRLNDVSYRARCVPRSPSFLFRLFSKRDLICYQGFSTTVHSSLRRDYRLLSLSPSLFSLPPSPDPFPRFEFKSTPRNVEANITAAAGDGFHEREIRSLRSRDCQSKRRSRW